MYKQHLSSNHVSYFESHASQWGLQSSICQMGGNLIQSLVSRALYNLTSVTTDTRMIKCFWFGLIHAGAHECSPMYCIFTCLWACAGMTKYIFGVGHVEFVERNFQWHWLAKPAFRPSRWYIPSAQLHLFLFLRIHVPCFAPTLVGWGWGWGCVWLVVAALACWSEVTLWQELVSVEMGGGVLLASPTGHRCKGRCPLWLSPWQLPRQRQAPVVTFAKVTRLDRSEGCLRSGTRH